MIYELAGIAGVDPNPLTLAELSPMAAARAKHEWDMASSLLALIHNVNCLRRADRLKPEQLNPYRTARRRRDAVEIIDMLVETSKRTQQ